MLITDAKYAYVRPEKPSSVLFWKIRSQSNAGRKTFFYITADPQWDGYWGFRHGEFGLNLSRADRDRALFGVQTLRKAGGVVLWCEGEKDALNAMRFYGVAAVSHHGGAGKATPEQADHFLGYKGLVGVVADRDDPGYACALRRLELLQARGVRADVVRAADDVTPNGVCSGACYCEKVCPPPTSVFGTDLTDHALAKRKLSDLEVVSQKELWAASERWAKEHVSYCAPMEEWEREMIKNSRLIKYGWDGVIDNG